MSHRPPDVTAFELSAAEERLAAEGFSIARITQTRAPRASATVGSERVVRQRLVGDREVELITAHTGHGDA